MSLAARMLPSSRPRPATTATTAAFEKEVVVYCERTQRVHCLDRFASIVWALCDGTRTVSAIVAEAASLTEHPTEEVRHHVEAALSQFRDLGITRSR